VNPNKRQATMNGFIRSAALRDVPFLRPVALFLTDVQQAYSARNALQRTKNSFIATAGISVNRP